MSDQLAMSKNSSRVLDNETSVAMAQTASQDQRLSAIFEIARILVTEQDLETMLQRFLSCLITALEAADTGILLLYDESSKRLTARGAQGYHFDTLRRIHIAPGEATSGKAFQSGQVELYPSPEAIATAREDLRPENQKLFETATAGLGQPQCAICIPLIAGQAKVGALLLENRTKPGSFVEEEILFLKAVADIVASSVENARLRDELQTTRALEEANRLKAELISTLAHEMRTPLTSIKGYSTALLMEETSFDLSTQHEFLQIIDEECDILQDLIHDLLESSIIDAGLLRLEPQPVRLPRLTQGVIDDLVRRSKKHRFLIDFSEDFPLLDADPLRVEQVLRNLLDNALKYSPRGGLVVVRGEVHGDEAIISVADQGVGIAPEHLNRLFEKFFRVEWGLGRHVVGSGLGLPISRTIVESHGGRIWAESTLGEGSTFYFTLPLEGLSQVLAEQEKEQ